MAGTNRPIACQKDPRKNHAGHLYRKDTLANAIAFPLVYLTMIAILANLPYPIKISWDYFVSTAILSFVLALLAVGYRAYRAATANPVDSLRYE